MKNDPDKLVSREAIEGSGLTLRGGKTPYRRKVTRSSRRHQHAR